MRWPNSVEDVEVLNWALRDEHLVREAARKLGEVSEPGNPRQEFVSERLDGRISTGRCEADVKVRAQRVDG